MTERKCCGTCGWWQREDHTYEGQPPSLFGTCAAPMPESVVDTDPTCEGDGLECPCYTPKVKFHAAD